MPDESPPRSTLSVEVHLHGGLVRYVPGALRGVIRCELPVGARVVDVLASFDLPPDRRVIVGINGQAAGLDDAVIEGARIDLVPPISGGQGSPRDTRRCEPVNVKGPSD